MLDGQGTRVVLLAQCQAFHEHELIPRSDGAARAAAGGRHIEKDAAVQAGMNGRVEVDAACKLVGQRGDGGVVRKVVSRELGAGNQ